MFCSCKPKSQWKDEEIMLMMQKVNEKIEMTLIYIGFRAQWFISNNLTLVFQPDNMMVHHQHYLFIFSIIFRVINVISSFFHWIFASSSSLHWIFAKYPPFSSLLLKDPFYLLFALSGVYTKKSLAAIWLFDPPVLMTLNAIYPSHFCIFFWGRKYLSLLRNC